MYLQKMEHIGHFTRCKTTNLYTYVIDEESEVLIHSTLVGESNKFSNIDQIQIKAVRKLHKLLASLSDYDLVNLQLKTMLSVPLLLLGGTSESQPLSTVVM